MVCSTRLLTPQLPSIEFITTRLILAVYDVCREQIMEMAGSSQEEITATIKSSPSALEANDIEDFCSLAQYYASKTPQSFRRVSILSNNKSMGYFSLRCVLLL